MRKVILNWALMAIFLTAVSAGAAGDNLLWTVSGMEVCRNSDDQQQPQAVPDGFGGVVAAWQNYRRGEDLDIYTQRLDRRGRLLWADGGLPICSSGNDQQGIRMVRDAGGNIFLAWSDYRGNEDFDIYVQKIDADGSRLWSADGTDICRAPGNQTIPQMAPDGAGGVVVVWQDARREAGDIYAQRVDHSGTPLWDADGISICSAPQRQSDPQILADGAGGVIIVWQDLRRGDETDLYVQHLDDSGAALCGPGGVAVCTAAGSQRQPRLLSDGSGGAIVIWEDSRSGQWDIYAQRIDAGGNGLWTPEGIAVCDVMGNQVDVTAAADGSRGAVIAWNDGRHGQEDIYAQRIDQYGTILWPDGGAPVCTHEHRQTQAQLVSDEAGGAIIAWQDYRSGSRNQIFAQRINSYGRALRPAGGRAVCEASSEQTEPRVISDGSGGAIVVWRDQRGDDADIFAQRVSFNPSPEIQSIEDMPNDQGRSVLILWQPSYYDTRESGVITSYSVWRKSSPGSNIEAIGIEWDGVVPKDRTRRVYRRVERSTETGDLASDCWEWLGSVPAGQNLQYGYLAATPQDSSFEGTALFWFTVSAHTAEPFELWESVPRKGYSVDDIPPGRTQLGVANLDDQTGAFELIWDRVSNGNDGSPELGPVMYHIHCDVTSGFVPGEDNHVWTTPDLSFRHTDRRILDITSGIYYLVIATDGSGNRSVPSNRVGGFKLSLNKTR